MTRTRAISGTTEAADHTAVLVPVVLAVLLDGERLDRSQAWRGVAHGLRKFSADAT